MSLCNSHDYERLYFQKSIIENCFIEPYVKINYSLSLSIQFNSYVYFRHKTSIYNKIYIQLDKIHIRIYNNAIRSIRNKKGDFKENIFIMLQCRTTNSKCLRRLEPRSHK